MEEFTLKVFHEKLGVQRIGVSARRKWTSHGSDMVSRERGLEQRVCAATRTQKRRDSSCKESQGEGFRVPKAEHANI